MTEPSQTPDSSVPPPAGDSERCFWVTLQFEGDPPSWLPNTVIQVSERRRGVLGVIRNIADEPDGGPDTRESLEALLADCGILSCVFGEDAWMESHDPEFREAVTNLAKLHEWAKGALHDNTYDEVLWRWARRTLTYFVSVGGGVKALAIIKKLEWVFRNTYHLSAGEPVETETTR